MIIKRRVFRKKTVLLNKKVGKICNILKLKIQNCKIRYMRVANWKKDIFETEIFLKYYFILKNLQI